MSAELNAEFCKKPSGLVDFLRDFPLEIEVGQFAKPAGTPAGTKSVDYGAVMNQYRSTHTRNALKFEVIENWGIPVWCDFELATAGTQKGLVLPRLYPTSGGSQYVKMFYLPWKEDMRHTMDLNDGADYFMTASMHGCRFEVHRKPDGPWHVSHSNVQPKPAYDAQGMLKYLKRADPERGRRIVKFGKDLYYADSTRLVGTAQHRLMSVGIAPEEVLDAHPDAYKANVFGKRSSTGEWSFYYQLWGMIKVKLHERVKKKKWLGLNHDYIDQTNEAWIKQVFLVKELYPTPCTIFKLHKNRD
jgi:hypothetical protein